MWFSIVDSIWDISNSDFWSLLIVFWGRTSIVLFSFTSSFFSSFFYWFVTYITVYISTDSSSLLDWGCLCEALVRNWLQRSMREFSRVMEISIAWLGDGYIGIYMSKLNKLHIQNVCILLHINHTFLINLIF